MMKHRGLLIVISGFSGVGKGTLVGRLLSSGEDYALSVSMTTRQPRPGEVDGVHYFFVDEETFLNTARDGGLLEYAQYCGCYYGTPRAYVQECLDSGRNVILEIEIQGARRIRELFPEALLLFVMPPSARELMRRLRGRGSESRETAIQRMERALAEAEGIEEYEYIVVNDDLEQCVEQIQNIVEAARMRPDRNSAFIDTVRSDLADSLKGD